jgi:hypothetical protein
VRPWTLAARRSPGWRRRDPVLDRRPLPLRAVGDRPPPGHRPHRAGRIPANLQRIRGAGVDVDRPRDGVHHPLRRRPGRPHCLRGRTASSGRGAEELPTQSPTTCGKAEPFQQTLKKWLAAQPVQPTTLEELQALLDRFVEQYCHRLCRSPESRSRRPQPRHPPPGSHRHRRPGRIGHAARQRSAPPHRRRPNPRPNPRPAPRPRPQRPHYQRRHRRTPPRTRPRPHPRLPAHRCTQGPNPPHMTTARTPNRGFSRPGCLERSHGAPDRTAFEPTIRTEPGTAYSACAAS